MSKMMTYKRADTGDMCVTTILSLAEVHQFGDKILRVAIERIADDIAKRFLAEHAQELMTLLDPQAIANLAVADAAGAIREQLGKKLPDKIVEVVRTEREVYQRGIFGGLKRVR